MNQRQVSRWAENKVGGPVSKKVTLTVLKVGSCGRSRVLAINKHSNRLNRSDQFWSSSSIPQFLKSVEEDGRWDVNLTGLADFTGLELVAFLSSIFFSASYPLKPGDLMVLWPSPTPTTDTCAGSTRVVPRVTEDGGSLDGVEDLVSRFSFFNL